MMMKNVMNDMNKTMKNCEKLSVTPYLSIKKIALVWDISVSFGDTRFSRVVEAVTLSLDISGIFLSEVNDDISLAMVRSEWFVEPSLVELERNGWEDLPNGAFPNGAFLNEQFSWKANGGSGAKISTRFQQHLFSLFKRPTHLITIQSPLHGPLLLF